jgi:hypothetical protein
MDFFRVFLRNHLNENVLRHDLHKEESSKIDPASDFYFSSEAEKADRLDAGIYYFTQIRRDNLCKDELVEAAVELQKEALWIRLKLKPVLYIRSLYEDNAPVTQLWRPVVTPKPASPAPGEFAVTV